MNEYTNESLAHQEMMKSMVKYGQKFLRSMTWFFFFFLNWLQERENTVYGML